MRVAVAGSGLLGSALVDELTARGHEVRRLVRRAVVSPVEIPWEPGDDILDPDALMGCDAVVNLGGAGIGDHRWTPRYRQILLESRIRPTALLARTLAGMSDGPRVLLQASAVGYYGDRGEVELTETTGPGSGFLAQLCRSWEAATAPADAAGIRVACLRSGIALGPGGAFGRLLPLLRFGLGGPLGPGRNYWSWITTADHARAVVHLLASQVSGPVNLTAPEPVPQRELIAAVAQALRRPAVLRVPELALQVVLGGGLASDLLSSQRALPEVLLADGFSFSHPSPTTAARWLVALQRD